MADGELQVEIVPDEQALENIEEKQLEISGEPDSVQQAAEANEEQNERLGGISRSLFSIAKIATVILAVLAPLIPILRSIGEKLGINFEDVRTMIVRAIDELVTSIKEAVTLDSEFSGATDTPVKGFASGLAPPGFGPILANAAGNIQEDVNSRRGGNTQVNVLTSRDQMIGDSTMQEFQSNSVFLNNNSGGSGGNINP